MLLQLPLQHLRLVKSSLLSEYVDNTEYVRSHGTAALGRRLMQGDGCPVPKRFQGDYILYHSWLPGFIELSRVQARNLAIQIQLASEASHGQTCRRTLPMGLLTELAERGWISDSSLDIDKLVSAAQLFCPMQNKIELRQFLARLRNRQLKTIVELGSGRGGTLYCLAQVAEADATLVSVDFAGGRYGGGQSDSECELFRSFASARQTMVFVRDRTFHWNTHSDVQNLLQGRDVDLLLIDADHSYGAVKSDFFMYRGLVGRRGLLAIHDISMFPDKWGRGHDVGIFWQELQREYFTESIIDPSGVHTLEKLPTEEHSFGFGIIDFAVQDSRLSPTESVSVSTGYRAKDNGKLSDEYPPNRYRE